MTYTHIDKNGMRWRFVGNRPISELADRVIAQAQLPPREGPQTPTRAGKRPRGRPRRQD